jgi:serine/threonine protein kinase
MQLIIMEYADGGDLYKQIKARLNGGMKYFKEHEVLFIFLQLCLALDHIHAKKMMHRDLKAANVLLTSTGLVKLGDFGFSRQYEDSLSKPVGSTFCGTPYYLSPELWRRAPYSKKSEMWALGVVLYEIMALRRPFNGANIDELIDNILHARYAPLPDMYPPELRAVVDQLLQLDPARRPSLRQLFQNPYIRQNGLQTLRRSVETHSRIAPEVRAAIVASIDETLLAPAEYDCAQVKPCRGRLRRYVGTEAGWRECDLELTATQVIVRDPAAPDAPPEVMDLAVVTSVCAIDQSIAGAPFVFAMKSNTGKAFWFLESTPQGYQDWMTTLQNATA